MTADTLTEFLLARIAEDEADATKAVDDDRHWLHLGEGVFIQGDAGFSVSSGWLTLPRRYEAGDHIARHDPARVLAECEAKRRIVEMHEGPHYCSGRHRDEATGLHDPCSTVMQLAAVYADHPDYRDEWRP